MVSVMRELSSLTACPVSSSSAIRCLRFATSATCVLSSKLMCPMACSLRGVWRGGAHHRQTKMVGIDSGEPIQQSTSSIVQLNHSAVLDSSHLNLRPLF
eukprot:1233902-Amphidinium_carterae.2